MTEVVFLAADLLPHKGTVTAKGGAYLPQFWTLPQKYIPKCELTVLKPAERVDNVAMLHPDDLENWQFEEQEPVKMMVEGKGGEPVEITVPHPAIARQQIEPQTEVRRMTQWRPDALEFAIVHIPALQGADEATVLSVQLFFFPQWFTNGRGHQIATVEEQIIAQRARITEQEWDEGTKALYRNVADQLLESCVRFRAAARQYLQNDANREAAINAATHPYKYTYNPVAELVQKQL